jgi:signal transduction histidine kinase/ligand-binding sensor domain-containing protein
VIYAAGVIFRRGSGLRFFAVLLAALGCASELLLAQPRVAGAVVDLPVTNGLIRWWPNLFDARDEITGQEGVVMGVLPPVETGAEDETEFGLATGWVQLQPAITNEVFTLAFWVRIRPAVAGPRLLVQESSKGEWIFQSYSGNPPEFFIGPDDFEETDRMEYVPLSAQAWHHVAIARRADGTGIVWVDGARALDGRRPHAWPGGSRWLSVGNSIRGADYPFHGALRDLCAFNRVLTDREARALQAAGVPRRPARNTAARLAATAREMMINVSTNVVTSPARAWLHRRFTTEDGLPGNVVKAILQARTGYLWVGTEAGLARFDGRQFRSFTAENTPALKAIGQTVWSLSEDADGTIWAGIFGGLLRIRDLEFTAFTNGLPQRFVLQAEPAGDGSVWVAGFNAFVPRGPLWLRRYHPDASASSAEVAVPGHIRRLVVATNGVWLATEQPQLMLFWDGQAAAPTVVGAVGHTAPSIRLASHALAERAHVRAWNCGGDGPNWWAEVGLGNGAPVFHWLWDTQFHRPWAARWNGPIQAPEMWLGVFHDLVRQRNAVLEKLEFGDQSASREIVCVTPNHEGGVWFGTEEDGLHLVQERLVRVITTRDGLSGNDIRSVCATLDGRLWVGTAEGLNCGQNGAWIDQGKGGRVRSVACDPAGRAWFGAQGFGQDQLRRDRFDLGRNSVSLGLDWQDPNSLRFGSDRTLWVVCERGLTWLKPERLVQNPDGNWVPDPTSTEPVFGRYAIGKELPKMFPLGLVEDGDGSMWLGSLGHGLFRVADGRVENFTEKDGLPGKHCVPVYLDDSGAMWIVSEGALSRRAGGRFQTITEKDGLPKDSLLDLIEDDVGHFWISGKRGIHRVARRELEEFFAGRLSRVHSLTLGARDGLLTPECSSPHYPTMAKTPDGHIWVATRNGLATFDPRRVQLDTQPLPALIERLVVNREELPLAGVVAAGVPPAVAGGVSPPGSRPPGSALAGSSPFASSATASAGQDATARRQAGTPAATDNRPAISSKAAEPSGTPLKNSRPIGASAAHPAGQDATARRQAGTPAATGHRPAISRKAAESIHLPPGSGERLEFHYTAISLVAADRVKFRHRLDGYDSDWSPETDLRLAFFTNLRPGAYRFRVKAANAHGVWNEQETTLSFVIQPFFWQRRPFHVGVAVAVVALAGGLHWRRLRGQRRLQELRHRQALMSEKARIAADMHDELGAALTQIAILGEVAKSQAGNQGQTRSTLDRISQAARDVTARMSDLVWATNPRNDTLDNLVAYLREHAASQLENTPIRPRLDFPVNLPAHRVSATFRRNLLLVLKESLTNVIKHARANEVCVHLEITRPYLRLRIQDDGRGFDAEKSRGTGNGLGNMRQRVRDLGGEFSFNSASGKGTCIDVTVPVAGES